MPKIKPSKNITFLYKRLVAQQNPPFFFTPITALWPMKQSSILLAKFGRPVAHQNFSFLATAHEYQTGLQQIAQSYCRK